MEAKLTDGPCEYVRPGEQYQITSYFELLEHLGLFDPLDGPDAPANAEQRSAIAEWLRSNEPHQLLAWSLRDHGIGALATA